VTAQKYILFFNQIDKDDLPLVGGKGANLGEMTKAGFPVPNGFAVTVAAYDAFLDENDINKQISNILKATDKSEPNQLNAASKQIERLILKSNTPKEVAQNIFAAYKKLSGRFKKSLVAVRSSATAEDLPTASFAGQQESFLNIKGEANLIETVKKCWASLFTARAIFYREENNISHEKVKISVMVQLMVQSEVSGVVFTIDPVTNDKNKIIIEAVWGLGEFMVKGQVVPDRYSVQKETFSILSKKISDQSVQLVKKGADTKKIDVPKKKRNLQKINDKEITKLAVIADKLHKHYYFPQDVEWAKQGKNLYIVQTRPVTTTLETKDKKKGSKPEVEGIESAKSHILTGAPASPGIATGHVRILKSAKEIDKVKSGDILVSEMTSPDFVPAMRKASAIVTDQGGQTSHAAIVSRELGVPCVVGTKEATTKLKDNLLVTVDGSKGLVFLGGNIKTEILKVKPKKERELKLKTATKLYVNLGEPDLAKRVAKKNIDGAGLVRAEFMIANIGIHPKEAIKLKKQEKFIEKLSKDLMTFCKAFGSRPVVYRTTDFKTNEYRALPGGKAWEPEEPNPMLGYRGAYRYIADPEVFMLELRAIKEVRHKYKNLWVMIPYVRSPEELAAVRRMVAAEGLFESPSFKFWMMVELPVNVILLDKFIEVGIDGVSIGSNDLTMLISGTDRDNAEVAKAFNERSPAVKWAIRRVVRICNKNNISSSICGQAPSTYDDLVEELVGYGITSISVNPDAINRVRRVIVDKEREIIRNK